MRTSDSAENKESGGLEFGSGMTYPWRGQAWSPGLHKRSPRPCLVVTEGWVERDKCGETGELDMTQGSIEWKQLHEDFLWEGSCHGWQWLEEKRLEGLISICWAPQHVPHSSLSARPFPQFQNLFLKKINRKKSAFPPCFVQSLEQRLSVKHTEGTKSSPRGSLGN